MKIIATSVEGVRIIQPKRWNDDRGFFSEVFRADVLAAHGIIHEWWQDNHSLSRARGVIRGLHFQIPPHDQAKLIRVVRGSIFDVAVDLRKASPTFGGHIAVELSAENWTQLYIPPGLAHGFCTLEADTEVAYKVAGRYDPGLERGLRWNAPDLNINWPIAVESAVVNERDRNWPAFSDFDSPF